MSTRLGVVCTWDSDVLSADRALMVSQGTPEVLGQMLVETSIAGLEARGVDPEADEVTYCWHYSQATVTDQNSWQVAGEAYIAAHNPNWKNINPDNYYSEQDAEKAITVGETVLSAYPDIDLVICNDITALPGQLQAAENMSYDSQKVTITGFATPNAVKEYCSNGTIYNWGLWDCALQRGRFRRPEGLQNLPNRRPLRQQQRLLPQGDQQPGLGYEAAHGQHLQPQEWQHRHVRL